MSDFDDRKQIVERLTMHVFQYGAFMDKNAHITHAMDFWGCWSTVKVGDEALYRF